MNGGNLTVGSDGVAGQKSVVLIIVANGKLDVTWHNSGIFVSLAALPASSRTSATVLKDFTEVQEGTSTDALSVASLLLKEGDSSNRERKSVFEALKTERSAVFPSSTW